MDSAPAEYPTKSLSGPFEGIEQVSEEFCSSPTIGKIAAALAKAQGQIDHASKDRENSHFHSKYADLAAVIDACRGPLSEHGIARHQATMSRGEDRWGVRTMLAHESGEYLANTIWVAIAGASRTPQAIGSLLTYLRRYSLSAAVGLAQDDDDAEATLGRKAPPTVSLAPPRASSAKPKAPPAETTAAPEVTIPEGHVAVRTHKGGKWVVTGSGPKLTDGQQARIKILQDKAGVPDPEYRAKLTNYFGVATSTELTQAQADDLIGRLESAVAMKGA